jgi:hypothetical protein
MATNLILGTMTQGARKAIHTKRTTDALALIKKDGGEFDTLAAA